MKQIAIIGLFLILIASCKEDREDSFSVEVIKNEHEQVSDVKIIRDHADSNFVRLTFFKNGEIEMLREYRNGKENGKHYRWRENGNLAIEGFKVNGEYDRVTREIYDDGRT